jgi:hypothetical protein
MIRSLSIVLLGMLACSARPSPELRRQKLASLNVNYEMQDGRRSASGLKSLLEIEPHD